MSEKEQKSGSGKAILIGLAGLLLVGNIGQFAWNSKTTGEKEAVITAKQTNIDSLETEKAAHLTQINQLETDLKMAIEEKEKMGLDVADLDAKLQKLIKDKNYYIANYIKPSVRKDMEAKIANYTVMLKQQEDEIRVLKAKNDSLYRYNGELKNVIVSKDDSILQLAKIKQEQAQELEKGRALTANGFKVTAIKNPDKNKMVYEATQIYKDKDIVQAKIDFEIGANPIANIEEKQVYVQILSPSNDVLYDNAQGGGSFQAEGKTMNYSIKQNIMYNRSTKQMSLIWDKKNALTAGNHQVRVWCEGQMIGKGSFAVK
jgi:hypothetical protein